MSPSDSRNRRSFLFDTAAAGAVALTMPHLVRAAEGPMPDQSPSKTDHQKLIGIQVGAVSFVDEGVEPVLDIFQEKGQVNALFIATFTYGRGIAGRQVPGQPLPDHGKQEYDEKTFHGGNYATPHPQFYEKTSLKPIKAPDHGDLDILELVLPSARRHGLKTFCWYEDNFDQEIPNIGPLREVDLSGRPAKTLCPLNPDYRNFLVGTHRGLLQIVRN